MRKGRFVAMMLAAGTLMPGSGVVSGQDFPSKPIRIITSAPGGGSDFAARLIASSLTPGMGQQVIVDNRGGGIIAPEVAVKAPSDGYSLLYYGSTLWLLPLMRDNVPWDVIRDFAPVILTVSTPTILTVHPSLPVKSVKDLIALARARPGDLNYALGATGSANHLSAELFKAMAGVNIVRIVYKGQGPAILALMSGEIQTSFAVAASVQPHLKSGKLRALAVSSAKPSALFPGLPTVAASLPGYEAVSPSGIFAPAKTPEAIINRLNQEIGKVLARTDVKEKFAVSGVEVVGGSPQEFAAKIKSEITYMGKVIKEAGIRDQ